MDQTDQQTRADPTGGGAAGSGGLGFMGLVVAAGLVAAARVYVGLGDYLWSRDLYCELSWIALRVMGLLARP